MKILSKDKIAKTASNLFVAGLLLSLFSLLSPGLSRVVPAFWYQSFMVPLMLIGPAVLGVVFVLIVLSFFAKEDPSANAKGKSRFRRYWLWPIVAFVLMWIFLAIRDFMIPMR